jgi:hypothetical protein
MWEFCWCGSLTLENQLTLSRSLTLTHTNTLSLNLSLSLAHYFILQNAHPDWDSVVKQTERKTKRKETPDRPNGRNFLVVLKLTKQKLRGKTIDKNERTSKSLNVNCYFVSLALFFCQNVKWWFLCAVLTKNHSFVNFVWWKLKFTIHQRFVKCFTHGNYWLILFLFIAINWIFTFGCYYLDIVVKCGCYSNQFGLATKWLLLILPKQWVIPILGWMTLVTCSI